MSRRVLSFALSLSLLSGCAGTETGNPPVALQPGFAGHAPMGIAVDPAVEDAWASVVDVTLLPCEGGVASEPADGVVRLTGPGGDAPEVAVPAGDYCGLAFALAPATAPLPTDAPDALDGASLVVEGTSGGASIRVASALASTISLETDTPFPIDAATAPLLVGVDWSLAFAGANLYELDPEPHGVIVVDAARHPDRLAIVEANLPGAIALYRDVDGDGVLDREESTPIATP